jgi:hypothetical protein
MTYLERQPSRSVAERVADPMGAAQALVASAVWGTGNAGRGRARRLRIFEGGWTTVGEKLAEVTAVLRERGPDAAYGRLHGQVNAVKNLGPSFGTKFLYFAGYDHAPGGRRPLILDQYVAKALNRLCGWDWPTTQGGWKPAQYTLYLDTAHQWANEWATDPDVIERVLFDIGKSSRLAVSALSGV